MLIRKRATVRRSMCRGSSRGGHRRALLTRQPRRRVAALEMRVRPNVLAVIQALREQLNTVLLHKAEDPSADVRAQARLVRDVVTQLISDSQARED